MPFRRNFKYKEICFPPNNGASASSDSMPGRLVSEIPGQCQNGTFQHKLFHGVIIQTKVPVSSGGCGAAAQVSPAWREGLALGPVLLYQLRLRLFSLLAVRFTIKLMFHVQAPKGCKRYCAN